MIVLDSSVVLATFLNEPGSEIFLNIAGEYAISSVNLGEVVTKLTEIGYDDVAVHAATLPILANCHVLSAMQGVVAGVLRRKTRHLGLSMGGRCCLALGLDLGAEVWTADRAWAGLDLGVKVLVIR